MSESLPWTRAIVVGASSGIGRSIARQLAEGGTNVAAVARREDELSKLATEADGKITPVVHDVRHVDEVPDLFDRLCAALGGLDLVVYAAGVMPRVAPDHYDTESDRFAIDVNVTGAIAWLNQAAGRFAVACSGTIVGLGSMAGERGRKGFPAYGASKAALHSYLESLRNRLAPKGITVVTAKLGFVDTVMTQDRGGVFWLISPDEAAAAVLSGAARGASTVYVPARWRAVSWMVRAIPSRLFRYLPI